MQEGGKIQDFALMLTFSKYNDCVWLISTIIIIIISISIIIVANRQIYIYWAVKCMYD